MENKRRHKWDCYGRSQNRRPPRTRWKPTVPSWEKQFCKVVGSLDWETLLQRKKFMHLYDNVISWDDSAGEEAFRDAKKRFWSEMNGRSCDLSLPDPDLYIDTINWDSEIDPELLSDLEDNPSGMSITTEGHEPVVIFGDSLVPNGAFLSTMGWGDDVEKSNDPANCLSADPRGQCCDNLFTNGAANAFPGYSKHAWRFSNEIDICCDNERNWSYANKPCNYVGQNIEKKRGHGGQRSWNESNYRT